MHSPPRRHHRGQTLAGSRRTFRHGLLSVDSGSRNAVPTVQVVGCGHAPATSAATTRAPCREHSLPNSAPVRPHQCRVVSHFPSRSTACPTNETIPIAAEGSGQ